MATAFIEARLNDRMIELDTVAGIGFSTLVSVGASGYEQRNANWSQSRGRWELGERNVDQPELDALMSWFRTCSGRLTGFRWRDMSDYKASATQGAFAALTSTTFQMYKRYAIDGTHYQDRKIVKPVASSITLYKNGVASTDYTLDATTGILTWTGLALAPGDVLSWKGEFDVPVRFDVDEIRTTLLATDAQHTLHALTSVPIVELRA